MTETYTLEVRWYDCGYGVYCIEDQTWLEFNFDKYSEQDCGTYEEAEQALRDKIYDRAAYKNPRGIKYRRKES